MPTNLPTDQDMKPIQALRPLLSGGAHKLTSQATAVKNSTAFNQDTRVILVQATEDIYYRLGDSSVSATTNDHFLAAGVPIYLSVGAGKAGAVAYLSVLQVAAGGLVYISELE